MKRAFDMKLLTSLRFARETISWGLSRRACIRSVSSTLCVQAIFSLLSLSFTVFGGKPYIWLSIEAWFNFSFKFVPRSLEEEEGKEKEEEAGALFIYPPTHLPTHPPTYSPRRPRRHGRTARPGQKLCRLHRPPRIRGGQGRKTHFRLAYVSSVVGENQVRFDHCPWE